MQKLRKFRYWFLVTGILILLVFVISWFAFPWDQVQGGGWELAGRVIVGVFGVLDAGLGAFLAWKTINEPKGSGSSSFIFGDQINLYLQSHPEVSREKLQQQLAAYLGWVQESFGDIVLRGLERQDKQIIRLPLDSIYVPLTAEYETASDPAQQRKNSQSVQLDALLGLGQRLIITGGPGCGKSTVLQHIAWVLAESACTQKPELARQKLGLQGALPLPIYVPISLYAVYLRELPRTARAEESTLATYITHYLVKRQAGLSLDADFLAHLIQQQHPVLLLLDGLDEIPDVDLRKRVSRKIDDLVSGRSSLRVIVTSRTTAYYGDAMLKRDFQQVRVRPLEAEQIQLLIRRAYAAVWPANATTAKRRADELLQGIVELEDNRRQRLGSDVDPLVTTPLMVRMLLMVHLIEGRKLPDQRADLYQKVVDALLRPDYSPDSDAAGEIEHSIGGSLTMNREMLQYLAFQMHSRGPRQGRFVSEETLKEILNREETFQPFVASLITQTCERCTLLEERGGQYQFMHFSFQEFLAARYLALTYKTESAADFLLDGPVLENWWREPALLLVGYLDVTAPLEARRLLLRWISDPPQGYYDDVRVAAAELAASAYLECQQQSSDLKEKLQTRLLLTFDPQSRARAVVRTRAGDALARLGDPRPGVMTLDGLRFCCVPAGTFWMGAGDEAKKLDLPAFWMGEYPVSQAQFAVFAAEDGYRDPHWWDEAQQAGWWSSQGFKGSLDDSPRTAPLVYPAPFGLPNHPVVGVSWYEARAFVRWLTRRWQDCGWLPENWEVVLPVEPQWEKAARGGVEIPPPGALAPRTVAQIAGLWEPQPAWVQNPAPRRAYPWEGAFDLERANTSESGVGCTSALGCFGAGASPYGIQELSGNVWEWQDNEYDQDQKVKALRGGSWYDYQWYARCSYRFRYHPLSRNYFIGFRLALSHCS